jgi:hypothetical protein
MGLEIKKEKTTCMIVSQKPYSENVYVKLGTYNLETMEDCTYLGTVLTNKTVLRPQTEKNNYK